jgi:hypothetical protein
VRDAASHDAWLTREKDYGEPAKPKMLIDPGKRCCRRSAYQGYGSDEVRTTMEADAKPVEIDLDGLGKEKDSLFNPFTTTMVEIILNREPSPLNAVSRIFEFL